MSKEEYEKLKAELKEELRKEISNKKDSTTYWSEYSKELVEKLRAKGYTQPHKAITSLTYWARAITNANTVVKLTEKDMEKVKPVINEIVNIIPNLKEV